MSFQSQEQRGWFQSQFTYRWLKPYEPVDPILVPDLVDVVLHRREETNDNKPMNEEMIPTDDIGPLKSCTRPTMLEELQSKRNNMARNLSEVDAAICALNSNPEVAKTLEAVRKALRL